MNPTLMKNGHLENSLMGYEGKRAWPKTHRYNQLVAERERRNKEGWNDGVALKEPHP